MTDEVRTARLPGEGVFTPGLAAAQSVSRRNRVRRLLVVYGLVFAVVGVKHFNDAIPNQAIFMEQRQQGIAESISVLDSGGPPLLAGTGRALPGGDAPGMYIYAPLVAHYAGIDDARIVVKRMFIGAFAVLLLVYPLIFYELFNSVTAGAASAPLLVYKFGFLENTQFYWVMAWCLLLTLPVIALALKSRWRPASIVALTLTVMVAGLVTSIRSYAGLAILLASIIVVLVRVREGLPRALVIATLAAAYVSVALIPAGSLERARDAAVLVRDADLHSSLWHSAYIGLGYLANDQRILYLDGVAARAAANKDPKAEYLTDRYARTIRRVYLDEIRHRPGFVLRNVGVKAIVILQDAARRFWLVLLLIPILLMFGPARRHVRWIVVLTLPALLLGALPPLLVVPRPEYELAWLGAWGFLWLVAAAGSVSLVARLLTQPVPARGVALRGIRRTLAESRRSPYVAGVAVVAVAAVLVSSGPARSYTGRIKDAYVARHNQSPLLRGSPPAGVSRIDWPRRKVRPTFVPVAHIRLKSTPKGLGVTTDKTKWGTEIRSQVFALPPGIYELAVEGEVVRGGLGLGVLDASRNQWIAIFSYSTPPLLRQRLPFGLLPASFRQGYMGGSVRVARRTPVRVVLINGPLHDSSQWLIRTIQLIRRTTVHVRTAKPLFVPPGA